MKIARIGDAAAGLEIVPLAVGGVVAVRTTGDAQLPVSLDGGPIGWIDAGSPGGAWRWGFVDIAGRAPTGVRVFLSIGDAQASFRCGGWSGHVVGIEASVLRGVARDEIDVRAPVRVVALRGGRIIAEATTAPSRGGAFAMTLPLAGPDRPQGRIVVGVAGSDFVLEGGDIDLGRAPRAPAPVALTRAARAMTIAIRTATPSLAEAQDWGDHHFALSLRRAFEAEGWNASVLLRDSDPALASAADVTLCLRGRQPYRPAPGRINLLWLISHPDRLPLAECEGYDHVFVASDRYAATLAERVSVPVSVLHQATDPQVFAEPPERAARRECLFVGNSRREWRTMVRWCVEKDLPLALWGQGWEGLVPKAMRRGVHAPNSRLNLLYADSAVVLNDHWATMRDEGFLSNRLFDASAVAAPIITDAVAGLAEVFGDSIAVARDADELTVLVRQALEDPAAARARARAAQAIVLERHTFLDRAREIIRRTETLLSGPRRAP